MVYLPVQMVTLSTFSELASGMQATHKDDHSSPDMPTGCATSFTSTAIRFESILHRFSFSRKRRCLNPCPWTSASVERACQGASIENAAALCILWARLIQADESLARTAGQVEAFCHMLRQRQGYRLRGWLEEVEQHGEPELQACARHLHKEESAVQAGLTLAWSNGRLYPSPQTAEAASVWPGRRRLAQTADALPSL